MIRYHETRMTDHSQTRMDIYLNHVWFPRYSGAGYPTI